MSNYRGNYNRGNSNGGSRSRRRTQENKYPTSGYTLVKIKGYVQVVKEDEKNECDYVTFCIVDENDIYKKESGNTHYELIGATVPWEICDPPLEPGDHVVVTCIIRSWSKDGWVKLEMRAISVDDVNTGAEELMR